MFRCGVCGKNTKGKPFQIVLEWRKKTYPERFDAQGVLVDGGGVGTEAVRGAYACANCKGKAAVRP